MTNNERKECISALRQLLAMCDFVDQYGDCIDADPYFDAVETAIESLNETGWIPVSERLPDTADHVLVTLKWSDTNYEVCELDYLVTKYEAEHTGSLWAKNMIGHVIAWTPMPPAYKGE